MQHRDWASRWADNQIGFHQSDINHFLGRYAEQVWGDSPVERMYVPLCGKSLDMVFLADHATEVVGVEFVEQAVVEFFAERNLAPEFDSDPLPRYRGGNYVLLAADFFDVTTEVTGPIDAVFDRASLVALNAETRIRYADHLHGLLEPGARMLLLTFDYDQAEMHGPPFAVSHAEVHDLFSAGFDIQLLDTRDVLNDAMRSRGLGSFEESAFSLTRR